MKYNEIAILGVALIESKVEGKTTLSGLILVLFAS